MRCFDRDASSDHRVFFGICTETFVAFAVAFVGVKATFWRPHIVFRPVRVNSHVRPLGSRSLCRFLELA